MMFGRKPKLIDKTFTVTLRPQLIEVPLAQAYLNTLLTLFGDRGIPLELVNNIENLRVVIKRSIGPSTYACIAIVGKKLLEKGFRLKAFSTPALEDFRFRSSVNILTTAMGWGKPFVALCELPAPAMWQKYTELSFYIAKALKVKPKRLEQIISASNALLPSTKALRILLTEIARDSDSIRVARCTDDMVEDERRSLEACTSEAVVAVADSRLVFVMYLANLAGHLQPRRRVHSLLDVFEVEVAPKVSSVEPGAGSH
jgi:hypothetical protein